MLLILYIFSEDGGLTKRGIKFFTCSFKCGALRYIQDNKKIPISSTRYSPGRYAGVWCVVGTMGGELRKSEREKRNIHTSRGQDWMRSTNSNVCIRKYKSNNSDVVFALFSLSHKMLSQFSRLMRFMAYVYAVCEWENKRENWLEKL